MSSGIVTSDPNLNGQAHSPVHKSVIPFSAHVAGTYRFGEITPHFVAEVENNDKWPLRCAHNVRSFNLKAPLMSDIYLRKTYAQIPMEAILPLNWDKVYTNPVIGDDVDAKLVNCVVDDFPNKIRAAFSRWASVSEITSYDPNDNTTWIPFLESVIKYFVCLEYFFSCGSLFASLGLPLQGLLRCNFDIIFDDVFTRVNNIVADLNAVNDALTIVSQGYTYNVDSRRYIPESSRNELDPYSRWISFGHFMDVIRDDFDFSLAFDPNNIDVSDLNAINVSLGKIVWATDELQNYPEWPLNFKRVLAYQLMCYHLFSNDKIDYVYSAELYRQLVYNSFITFDSGYGTGFYVNTFSLNGLSYRFDYLSGYNLNQLFILAANVNSSMTDFSRFGDCCRILFGYNRSLRHLDYFSGAKSQPLAVGDSDTNVVGGKVSSIDITRNIQVQRFRNFVHLVGRKFEEYTAKLNGKHVDFDWHNPVLLSKGTSDVIYGSEIENNNINPESSGQPAQSTTAVLRGSANTTAFELEFDRPSVVIGVTWFDIERYYVNVIERQNFHVDRFDMFNEFMQYIGDQPIYRCELTPIGSKSSYFGYALRHQEYKKRVNRCFGGFASGMLPGWEFTADQNSDDSVRGQIGPDYIRSRPSELDPFFLSLTGYSRGTYWHFIIDNYNITDPVRPMVLTPQILG